MLRSFLTRLTSLALLLAAGFSQPAWELQHAALHRDTGHEVSDHGRHDSHSQAPIDSVDAPDHDLGHEHPAVQSPVKPARDLAQAGIAHHAATLEFRPATVTVVLTISSSAPARASPTHDYPSQPRAPPLS